MPRGGKRPGAGGKPGVPKAKTNELRLDLLETLRSKGFDPAAAVVEIHLEARKQYTNRIRKSANGFGAVGFLDIASRTAEHVMEFVYPKLARSELTGAHGKDLFQSFTDLVKQIASEEKK